MVLKLRAIEPTRTHQLVTIRPLLVKFTLALREQQEKVTGQSSSVGKLHGMFRQRVSHDLQQWRPG